MHMKTRMTLTIEPEISHRAKAVARNRGTSLSALVESLLAREAGIATPLKKTSFVQKWVGRLHSSSNHHGDARLDYLKQRHGL